MTPPHRTPTAPGGHAFDIFLSYHWTDALLARQVYERLVAAEYRVWFDRECIREGEPWLAAIERGLSETHTFVVLLTEHAPRKWVDAEVSAAIRRHYNDPDRHYRIVPIVAAKPNAGPVASIGVFLDAFQRHTLEVGDDSRVAQESLVDLCEALQTPNTQGFPARVVDNPYRGLEPFGLDDHHLFFGRDREVGELLESLRSPRCRWLQVEGGSGSGKSSLVRAGLLPALRRRLRTEQDRDWAVLVMRPAHNPLRELALAWRHWERGDDPTPEDPVVAVPRVAQIEAALAQPDGLRQLVKLSHDRSPAQFLLVVDQFEELFTLAADAAPQRAFTQLVKNALTDADCPFWLATTIRSDFLHHVAADRDWSTLLNQSVRYAVGPLTETGLRDAIVQPLRMAGGRLETDDPAADPLLQRLVKDTTAGPGRLPLLGHVLWSLWREARQRRDHIPTLRLTDLERLGGLGKAITASAEAVIAPLDDEQRACVRRLFLELVHVGHGVRDVRRTVETAQLLAAVRHPQAENLLAYLSGGRLFGTAATEEHPRLVVVHESRVDLVHEALLDEWPRLREWVNGARRDLERRDDIETAAATWGKAGQRDADLPGVGLLEHYNRWDHEPLPLSDTATGFLRRTATHHEHLRRTSRRRKYRMFQVVWCYAVVGTVLSVYAIYKGHEAKEQRNKAEAMLKAESEALVLAETHRKTAEANEARAVAGEQLAQKRLAQIEQVVGPAVKEAMLPQQAAAFDSFFRKLGFANKTLTLDQLAALANADPAFQSQVTEFNKLSVGTSNDENAIRALLKPSSVPALIVMLTDSDPQVRLKAAQLIRILGRDAKAALPAVMATTADPNPFVRMASIAAIGKLEPEVAIVLPLLQERLKEEAMLGAVAAVAAVTIGEFGAAAKPAVPDLIRAIRSRNFGSVLGSLIAVARIGPAASEAVPAIIEVLGEQRDHEIQKYCLGALVAVGPAASTAVPQLIAILKGQDLKLKILACRVLCNCPAVAGKALPQLIVVSGANQLNEIASMFKELTTILSDPTKPDAAPPDPLPVNPNESDETALASWATRTLAILEPPEPTAASTLAARLISRDSPTRSWAAVGLGRLGPQATPYLAELRKAREYESDEQNRAVMDEAIAKIAKK